jgi:hypothetical protein
MIFRYITFGLFIFCSGCGSEKVKECEMESIGVVTMNSDKSLTLQLRAEDTDSGKLGDAYFVIMPTDKRYNNILEHVGEIKVGETKDYIVKGGNAEDLNCENQ